VQGLKPSNNPTKIVKTGSGNELARFFIDSWFIKLRTMKRIIKIASRLILITSRFLFGVIKSL
jgi:ribosomal protein S19E (S16A)